MPKFAYKAVTADGADVDGELEAADRASALRELTVSGTCVTELAERNGRAGPGWFGRGGTGRVGRTLHIRPKQLGIVTRQLAVAIEAGLPLMDALDVVGRQSDHAATREVLGELARRVQQGANLSDAMAEHPHVFSSLYTRLVRVAEAGGLLDSVLAQLADMLEHQSELRERVKTASIYPLILLTLGVVSVVIIVTFIVPRIVESIGQETFMLPWPTRVLMWASVVIGSYWWLLLGGMAAVAIGWRQWVLTGSGRGWWDRVKLRIPIMGRLIRELEASRFARSLGTLTQGGVTITHALAVVRDTIQNTVMRDAVRDLVESVQKGESMAAPLARSGLFPPLLVQMVHVGENTGRLDEMLLRAADVHESAAKTTLERVVSVLPVAMVLLLAGVIGFIVAGLVLAIVEFQATGLGTAG